MDEETLLGSSAQVVYSDDHVAPPTSHALVGTVVVLHLVLFSLAMLYRWRELGAASDAHEAFDPSAPLTSGARYVHGTVELADGATLAAKVEIQQRGAERRHKGNWSHSWTEIDRVTTARPFYLRRTDGTRVRVEPGPEVLLVDAVDQFRWADRTTRFRTAELTVGEEATVEGVLLRGTDPEATPGQRGYRDASGRGWVMRPAEGTSLHISTEPLEERHLIRARGFRGTAILIVVLLLLASLAGSTYFARVFAGQSVLALVESTRHYTTRDSKGHTHHHHVADLDVSLPDRSRWSVTEELDSSDWVRVGRGDVLRYRFVEFGGMASSPGAGSSVHFWAWVFMMITVVVGALALAHQRAWRRWYEGKFNERGRGRLPDAVAESRAP